MVIIFVWMAVKTKILVFFTLFYDIGVVFLKLLIFNGIKCWHLYCIDDGGNWCNRVSRLAGIGPVAFFIWLLKI
jgi:hypothetical protein